MSNNLIICCLVLFRAYQSLNVELEQQIQEFMDREKLIAKVTKEYAIKLEVIA